MNKELYIPSCHKYIKKKDGTPDSQRIFSVAKSAYKAKKPDQELEDDKLFHFLKANNIIPEGVKKEDIDTEHLELCFTIISQYKCNSICQLCAYSPLYKNLLEPQESIIIGYALSNWKNLQILLNAGLTCRHFRAMIPVSENSSVSVIPLNRLAFEYMEKVPKSQSDMLSITENIISTLKQNNKNKLCSDDFKIAKKYLDNLFHSNYQNLPSDKIGNILKKYFQLSAQFEPDTEPVTQHITKNTEEQQPVHLEGLLTGKEAVTTGTRNSLQEITGKKKTIQLPKEPKPVLSQKTFVNKNAFPATLKKEKLSDNKITHKKEIKTCYTKNISAEEITSSSVLETERIPHSWQISHKELQVFHAINLETADTFRIKFFLEELLRTPLLPMELVADGKASSWILLYVQNKFYFFEKSNLTILDIMLPYLVKSKFRKIICYEPYQLYAYFYQQQIYDATLFSIRLGLDFAFPPIFWKCDINTALQQICNRENPDQAPAVMNSMRNYIRAFRILSGAGIEKEKRYWKKYYIMKFLGYSYNIKEFRKSKYALFSKETLEGYEFTYSDKDILSAPYMAVRYEIHWKSEETFPVNELLAEISKYRIPEVHDILLLSYYQNHIVFAVPRAEYGYLCDLVNNITCEFAEINKKLPIRIDERILNGENEKLAAQT